MHVLAANEQRPVQRNLSHTRQRTCPGCRGPFRYRLDKQGRLPSCGRLSKQRPIQTKQRTETIVLRLESDDLSERASETIPVGAHDHSPRFGCGDNMASISSSMEP